MGLVYVVGFCTTDFPDGTTGSVPDAWAWAPLARTSDPTNANRTDRDNVFIRLPLRTQRTVTWLSDGTTGHLLSSRTNWRSFVSFVPIRTNWVHQDASVTTGRRESLRSRDGQAGVAAAYSKPGCS